MVAQKLFWKLVKALDGTEIILVYGDLLFTDSSNFKKNSFQKLINCFSF